MDFKTIGMNEKTATNLNSIKKFFEEKAGFPLKYSDVLERITEIAMKELNL